MGNYKFYTPPKLAECLMKLIPQRKYQNIIDICCGSWNLLEAANKQFGPAHYVGVDVDPDSIHDCLDEAVFVCEDGRKFALGEKERYDLIVSNPPFGHLKEEERIFSKIEDKKGLISVLNTKRYENEMMQANLLLSAQDGVLVFILPATFCDGESYLNIRKAICQYYTIDSVIKLPIETFGSSKISTVALIMLNTGKQRSSSKLREIVCENEVWTVNEISHVPASKMKEGIWTREKRKESSKKEVTLFRGNISSAQMTSTGTKVLHCSSVVTNGVWEPSVRYCDDENIVKKAKIAMPGDIIVNRVGRYAKYWCVVKEKEVVSDCLIVLRASEKQWIYNKFVENSTNGKLNVVEKGVTTKYVTMKDIVDIL